jgi:hypothetical protein
MPASKSTLWFETDGRGLFRWLLAVAGLIILFQVSFDWSTSQFQGLSSLSGYKNAVDMVCTILLVLSMVAFLTSHLLRLTFLKGQESNNWPTNTR